MTRSAFVRTYQHFDLGREYTLAMLSRVELKHTIVEFVDGWEPKVSLLVLIGLGLAAFLTSVGSELGRLTQETAHSIHEVCLYAGACVGVLQIWSWLSKFAPPHSYDDPKRGIPARDESTPGLVFRTESLVGYPKYRFFLPRRHELDYFVEWSANDPTIGDANELQDYQRRLLYENWFEVNPKQFLMLQSMSTFGTIWETVAISIILEIPERTLNALKSKRIAVVDLRAPDLTITQGERPGRYLLYDTLIFATSFRETVSEYKRWHSLFHLSLFPPPTLDAPVTVLVEPDNLRLNFSIRRGRYGRYTKTRLVNKHLLFEFQLPDAADRSKRARDIVFFWRSLRSKGFEMPIGPP